MPDPVPEHLHTVTARLVLRDAAAAIDFYRNAFGADELGERFTGPGGELIHAELRIGDAVVMVTDEAADGGAGAASPLALGGRTSVILATYWPDVDAVWERAVAAGAEVIYPLADQFYGDRGGRLRDPFGHEWMLSQRIEDLTPAEIERRGAQLSGGEGG